jgi:hypothetical protein
MFAALVRYADSSIEPPDAMENPLSLGLVFRSVGAAQV